jgi:DNA processing protein
MAPDVVSQYLRIFHDSLVSTSALSRLLKEFGSMSRLLSLPEPDLRRLGLSTKQIDWLQCSSSSTAVQQRIHADLEWGAQPGNTIVCYESENYPTLLREIDAAPVLLFVTGQVAALNAKHFAIVGSRRASSYGKRNAYWMAQALSAAGFQICSGLALGVDTQAHKGALNYGCATVAVMGTGADRIYPSVNRKFAEQISNTGALVSEFPLGSPPYAHNFPRRNRIISGMSLGTLVVEANSKSGSLITSRFALEQNREVFALPGSINSQQSRGCHRLIKQGAKLVEEPLDILEELGLGEGDALTNSSSTSVVTGLGNTHSSAADATGENLLQLIGAHGCLFQSLMEESNLHIQELNSRLLHMEMKGLIRLEGGRYYRCS